MRSAHKRLGLGLVACLSLAMAPDAQATNYYVNPTGDDANAGTSTIAPFRTIKKAAKVVQNGDRVYVAAGTYTDDIWLSGVQDSSLPLAFIGSIGATVNAQWKVVNSNYVHISGFTFQGGATRSLIWKGSYEGLIEDCEFTAGDEGLLIKDGSLTIDRCQIQNFVHDGIQVDGAADVLLRDSTISGCQEAGIEVRKLARLELDNCTVDGNVGDGIEVNVTSDTIDDGPDQPPIDQRYLGFGLSKFEMNGNFVKGYDSSIGPSSIGATGVASSVIQVSLGGGTLYGDAYIGPSGSVATPPQVTGTVTTVTDFPTLPPIDDSYFATHNDNANIPLTDDGDNPLNAALDFTLSGGDGIDLPPGTYYFNKISLSGGSIIRISGPVVMYADEADFSGGSVANPGQIPSDCQIYARKNDVSFSGSSAFYGTAYAPLGKVNLSGSSKFYGMMIASQIKMSGSSEVYTDAAALPVAEQIFNGPPPSTVPPPSWVPISNNELDVRDSMLSNNAFAVRMVTPQAFTATSSDFLTNGWGLRLIGSADLTNCSVSNNTTGGLWLTNMTDSDLQVNNLTLANNGSYGLYAESCQLTFNSTNIADWMISGSAISVAGLGGDLTVDDVTFSGGTMASVQLAQGTLNATGATFSGSGYGLSVTDSDVTLTGCTLSGNTVGLYADQNISLLVNSSTFAGSAQWGACVTPKTAGGLSVTFDACTFHSNAGGVALVNAVDGEVSLRSGTLIRDNTNSGLHFENCNLTVNDQAGGTAWRTLRNGYGISSTTSTLTLSGVSVEESGQYGVYCTDSSVTVTGCTLTGVGGVYADPTNDSLIIASTTLAATSSGGWGVARYGGNVEVKNSLINGFDGGVFLSTATADQATVNNSTLVNLADYGVYLADGTATVQNTVLVGSGSAQGLTRVSGVLTHSYNLLDGFGTPFAGTTAAASELLENPRFADAANGDFRLGKGSPAINSGTDLTASGVATDMLGNARPSRKVFEIGAYEYIQSGGSVRVLDWQEKR